MIGTSGAERAVWAPPDPFQVPWGTWCYRVDERRIVVGGALNDGGSLLDWLRASLRLASLKTAEKEVAALEPDDPHTAGLARSAKQALDSGQLSEADALLDRAKEGELAALRQARELKQKAQEAEDRHALSAAALTAVALDVAYAASGSQVRPCGSV